MAHRRGIATARKRTPKVVRGLARNPNTAKKAISLVRRNARASRRIGK